MNTLPDYLVQNLKIVFVGYNPGEKSALAMHHFAGPNNYFYRLLSDSNITSRLYSPAEDYLLIKEGCGLTNIVSRPSRSSSDLTSGEMIEGADVLKDKIRRYTPKVVCFLGKDIYRKFAGLKSGVPIEYGPVPGEIHGTRFFVAPNPSGRSTIPYNDRLEIFKKLKEYVDNEN
jgi:G:T/U mismatch-specific DNA glycosylase